MLRTLLKMLRRWYKILALQMTPKSLNCSLHFHYLSTTYYHVFPVFPEPHVTAKSFLGHTSAVHFSFSDKQLHVQLTASSPGTV